MESSERFESSDNCFDEVPTAKDNETFDCVTEWQEFDPNMFEVFKKSQQFGEDEKQNKDIVDFMLQGNDACSEQSLKNNYPNFPDDFYKFIAQASNDKFKVLVKEAEEKENKGCIWAISREEAQVLRDKLQNDETSK
jgi:hypothetical protein